jgi:hypothetical protein
MAMYPCHICKKEFKTTQHLEQHKNRKKLCILSLKNPHLNSIVTLPTETNTDVLVSKLKVTDIIQFIKTAEDIEKLIKEQEMLTFYKNKIINLEQENAKLKKQLSVIKDVIQSNKNEIVRTEIDDENEFIIKTAKLEEDDLTDDEKEFIKMTEMHEDDLTDKETSPLR